MNSDDACATLWIYLMPLNYTSKNSWNGKFYVYVTTIKKKSRMLNVHLVSKSAKSR